MKRSPWLSMPLVGGLALTLLSGCYNVSYVARSKTPSLQTREHTSSFFLFGIVGEESVNTQTLCGATGVAAIKTRQTAIDVVLSIVTLGIYTPRTAVVTCAQ